MGKSSISRSTRWSALLLVLGMFVVAASGCGFLRGAAARSQHIETQTRAHVYNQPIGPVWSQARQLLFERGYTVRDSGEGGSYQAETTWKVDGKFRTRYLLSGADVGDGKSTVQFTLAEESRSGGDWVGGRAERDLDLEYELIKRVEPAAAARIEDGAEEAKTKAESEE